MPQLHQIETKILSSLSGKASAQQVADKAGLPLGSVLSFAESLREKGLILVESREEEKTSLSADLERYLKDGFPEERVHSLASLGKPLSALSNEEKSVGLSGAIKNGWVKVEGGRLAHQKKPCGQYALSEAAMRIKNGKPPAESALAILIKRKLAFQSSTKTVYLSPISGALKGANRGLASEVNILTREMLLSGAWKGANFRKYDVSTPVEIPAPAKRHMLESLKGIIS